MKHINISEYNIIHGVPPVMSPEMRVAIDSEWSGMDIKKKAHRPHGEYLCTTFYFGGTDVYIVEDIRELAQAFQNISSAGWIFANAIFDIVQLRRFVCIPKRDKMWDVLLAEQVRFSGYYAKDAYGLGDLCRRYLDLLLEKDERKTFETHVGEMTRSQVEYACKDPIATYFVFKAQRSLMEKDDLVVYKKEQKYMWDIIRKGGFPLDAQMWSNNAAANKLRYESIQEKYGKLVPNIGKKGQPLTTSHWDGLNLNSNPQVLARLKQLGSAVESTGAKVLKAAGYDTDEEADETCLEVAENDHDFVRDLKTFKKYYTRSSKYGQKFLDQWLEPDGKVYPAIRQREAGTSRSSSRNPNGQNIPSHDTKDFRRCFIAGKGKKLIIADYSAQEPRYTAELSQDETLIEIFNSGKDVYCETARVAFGETITKKENKSRRDDMKIITLATIYQKGKKRLAEDLKCSEDEADRMLQTFYYTFPKIKSNYILPTQKFAKEHGYVLTRNKAKLWINPYQGGGKDDRVAVNYPVQGTGAEMLKDAETGFTEIWDGDKYDEIAFVLPVHDELVLCVDEDRAIAARDLLLKIMLDVAKVYHPSIPAQVEITIADNWSEKS
jgi:DNA polymerase-1